jgi:hypothetical protein
MIRITRFERIVVPPASEGAAYRVGFWVYEQPPPELSLLLHGVGEGSEWVQLGDSVTIKGPVDAAALRAIEVLLRRVPLSHTDLLRGAVRELVTEVAQDGYPVSLEAP